VRSWRKLFTSALPSRSMNSVNDSSVLALGDVAVGDALDHLGDVLRGDRERREPERAGVLGPLAAEHDLEVRHESAALLAADAVEAEVGDVVLAARVEAAARLDAEPLQRLVGGRSCRRRVASARRRGPARTRCPACRCRCRGRRDVLDGLGAGRREVDRLELACSSGRSASLTQRSTMFCSTVSRTWSSVYSARCRRARASGRT
jgi:hypothetical protein